MTDSERIYQLMVLTARADETVDPREARVMASIVQQTADLQGLSDRAGLARAARVLLDQNGLAAAVGEIAGPIVDPGFRELAVQCCARVLAADGAVATSELDLMTALRRSFGYTVEEIERILTVRRR